MAHVRLFANLREAAGTGRVQIDGSSVRKVLDAASEQFGPAFELGVEHSRVWLNGEPTEMDASVMESDEIAVIPPVSGGAEVYTPQPVGVPQEVVVAVAVWLVLTLANIPASPALFVALLVGVFSLWAWDLVTSAKAIGRGVAVIGSLAGVFAGAVGTVFFSKTGDPTLGMALALGAGVVAAGVGAVLNTQNRDLVSFASSVLIGVVPGMAVASLTATRLSSNGQQFIWVFLGTAAFAVVGTWLISRMAVFRGLDPFMVGTTGAVASGWAVALFLGLPTIEFLVIALIAALSLVAGRAFGTVTRTGQMFSQDGAPGWLALLDGTALAGAVFLPALLMLF
jgi:molybdopterin converting factor small subunit